MMSNNTNSDKVLLETSYLREKAEPNLKQSRRLLYVSHFFAQFADGAWQFCIALFLAAFTNYDSLLLVSTYGLASGLVVCMFGSMAGQFVDRTNRLVAAQRFIWIQNILVLIATFFSYLLLTRDYSNQSSGTAITYTIPDWLAVRLQGLPINDSLSIFLLVGIHVCGSVAEVLNQGFSVAIEKDWIVVMAKLVSTSNSLNGNFNSQVEFSGERDLINDERREWLSTTNVNLKQIDLTCKICAPAAGRCR
mmetsp:Transcript_15796/g.23939  ORF Transcript_15796/g.23939 Transcript_15796/m.23939 type:complete len:249 (+) Transcript_15796:70-816(+)